MTLKELKIPKKQWVTALRVIRHPWREGQRCKNSKCGVLSDDDGQLPNWQACHPKHDIPMPAVTDELLMQMLREIVKRAVFMIFPMGPGFLYSVNKEKYTALSVDAAIICALASLEVE